MSVRAEASVSVSDEPVKSLAILRLDGGAGFPRVDTAVLPGRLADLGLLRLERIGAVDVSEPEEAESVSLRFEAATRVLDDSAVELFDVLGFLLRDPESLVGPDRLE